MAFTDFKSDVGAVDRFVGGSIPSLSRHMEHALNLYRSFIFKSIAYLVVSVLLIILIVFVISSYENYFISQKLVFIYILLALLLLLYIIKFYQSLFPIRLLDAIFNYSHDAIFITDKDGKVTHINEVFLKSTNYKKETILGEKVIFKDKPMPLEEIIYKELRRVGFWQGEFISLDSSGSEILQILTLKELTCKPKKYLGIFYPLKEYTKRIKNLEEIAYYDALTKLPNRRHFESLLTNEMNKTKMQYGKKMALLFIDFDDFKSLNDTYGHAIGDEFLKLISFKIKTSLSKNDIFARFSGDEFGIVLSNIRDDIQLERKILEILNVGKTKFDIANNLQIGTSLSIGVAIYSAENNIGFKELLKRADRAMYMAKLQGKGNFMIYKDIGFNNK